MEYVEAQNFEEEYNQELRYLDEPNQSTIYSKIDEDEANYTESKFKSKFNNLKEKLSSESIKNRSKRIREEEPMDVEPLEKSSDQKTQNSTFMDRENLDIEDPW